MLEPAPRCPCCGRAAAVYTKAEPALRRGELLRGAVTQQQPRQSGHRHGTWLVSRRHYDVIQIPDTSDTVTSVHYYDTLPPHPGRWSDRTRVDGAGTGKLAWLCPPRCGECGVRLAAAAAARGSIAE